jgi:hypothetical protein
MKKRILSVQNWEKYQARADKELPWFKLWGSLFKRPWFQELADDEKFVTIVFLDLARQFNNFIPDLSGFKGYLRGNYGVFMEDLRVFKLCKLLSQNGFLSDNASDLQDKIRVDIDTSDKSRTSHQDKPKKNTTLSDEAFIESLRADPLNAHVDFEREFAKMDEWLKRNPNRRKTQRFVKGWISRIERPLTTTFTKAVSAWDKKHPEA